jgi:hypothetical protein
VQRRSNSYKMKATNWMSRSYSFGVRRIVSSHAAPITSRLYFAMTNVFVKGGAEFRDNSFDIVGRLCSESCGAEVPNTNFCIAGHFCKMPYRKYRKSSTLRYARCPPESKLGFAVSTKDKFPDGFTSNEFCSAMSRRKRKPDRHVGF